MQNYLSHVFLHVFRTNYLTYVYETEDNETFNAELCLDPSLVGRFR